MTNEAIAAHRQESPQPTVHTITMIRRTTLYRRNTELGS
jgi:hypothetical protein